jgi:hypothetical protein
VQCTILLALASRPAYLGFVLHRSKTCLFITLAGVSGH